MTAVRGLLTACHPLPTAFVTGFVTAYGAVIGLDGGRLVLLALAVLLGQLSIGWCNDAVDAARDTAAARSDKPVAAGLVARRTVAVAAGVAVVACLAASFALGTAAGVVHTVVVAAGWAYDLGLKGTVLSGVPYVVAFGLLPAVATQARWAAEPLVSRFDAVAAQEYARAYGVQPDVNGAGLVDAGWPPLAVMAGTALLGLAAHFANTVGDTEADAATGVRGLPQRVGPVRSLTVTAVLVAAAAVVLALGAPDRSPLALAVLVAGAASAAGGVLLAGTAAERGRLAFRLTLAAVGLVVVGFLLAA
ncbi:UbiA family prenyltransferase [Kineosporia sp. A_224]|uniref:UbiA family prenyltransferase n=1 Tax=Kineosporia sp. A_224 TaxID=1962180 RepID=UPI000B4AAC73|nr:UbiA family prenyltransferase [Kineosporia sp. A_224]